MVRWDWGRESLRISHDSMKNVYLQIYVNGFFVRSFSSFVRPSPSLSPSPSSSTAFHLEHWRLSTKLHQLVLKCIIYGFELGYFFVDRKKYLI